MPGFYYQPTILTQVKKGMPAYEEELFGPVASMIEAKNESDAVQIANDNIYGLGGAIFSQDREKAEKMAKYQIQSGSCAVNGFVSSDPRLPFGGIGQSGYGRELSHYGLLEFANIKTVCVD
jgi:succinate-semialdehyde dehydrogenase/glutarate-semialdehyde dehydrogenase